MAAPGSWHALPLLVLSSLTLLIRYRWVRSFLISGAPVLQFLLLVGDTRGNRILPYIHLWPLFSTIDLAYAICATSWLLYWGFGAACWTMVFIASLFQIDFMGCLLRICLRTLLKQLHFIDDKVAFFDLPALEIDTHVQGLMVLRGITCSLSTLTFVVHGVEVGVKLTEDVELAIQADEVIVRLFRNVEVGNCYANLKGGEYEMTFATLENEHQEVASDRPAEDLPLLVEDTPILKAAFRNAELRNPSGSGITEELTNGHPPDDASIRSGFRSIEKVSPEDSKDASQRYLESLKFIEETSSIEQARKLVKRVTRSSVGEKTFSESDENALRATICSELHQQPSVPHPPRRSVKLSTLRNSARPAIKALLHRLPLLLRMLLNPICYFHPVTISSITATASGRWIELMLIKQIFKEYGETDSESRGLKTRIASWLADANFIIELANITGLAQVPIHSIYDIICQLTFGDVMAYRAIPREVGLKQVVRLGGADASFNVPSFLLPHHEHLLPPRPTGDTKHELEKDVQEADGLPKTVQAEEKLEHVLKDEATVPMSVHVRLPAALDQSLLDFVAAIVKASKVVEMERSASPTPTDADKTGGFVEYAKALNKTVKEGMKKAVVDGAVNDRWIAKVVGKITKSLERAKGEVGYAGAIPVDLAVYRKEYLVSEGDKLLP